MIWSKVFTYSHISLSSFINPHVKVIRNNERRHRFFSNPIINIFFWIFPWSKLLLSCRTINYAIQIPFKVVFLNKITFKCYLLQRNTFILNNKYWNIKCCTTYLCCNKAQTYNNIYICINTAIPFYFTT